MQASASSPPRRVDPPPASLPAASTTSALPPIVQVTVKPGLLEKLGYLSQVALVALAAFGYFYTVRPVYQKEQLSEEIARQMLEYRELMESSHATEQALSVARANVAAVERERERLQGELQNRLAELKALDGDRRSIHEQLARNQTELEKVEQARTVAEQRKDALLGEIEELKLQKLTAEANLRVQQEASADVLTTNTGLLTAMYAVELTSRFVEGFRRAIGRDDPDQHHVHFTVREDFRGRAEITAADLHAYAQRRQLPPLAMATAADPAVREVLEGKQASVPASADLMLFWYAPQPGVIGAPASMQKLLQEAVPFASGSDLQLVTAARNILAGEMTDGAVYAKYFDLLNREFLRRAEGAELGDADLRTILETYREKERSLTVKPGSRASGAEHLKLRVEFGQTLKAFENAQAARISELIAAARTEVIQQYASEIMAPVMERAKRSAPVVKIINDGLTEMRGSARSQTASVKAWSLTCEGSADATSFDMENPEGTPFARNDPVNCEVRRNDAQACELTCSASESRQYKFTLSCDEAFAPAGERPRSCTMTPVQARD